MSSTADPSSKRAAFAALFRTLRAERGLSYADLQQPTFASRGWISNVASGARWPDRSWVERADEVLAVNGRLTAAWDTGQAERELEKRTRALIVAPVKDSAEIVEAMAPDAVDVDALNGSVESLGIAYLSSPPAPMLDQGLMLRQESIRRLRDGAVRTHERADLYLAAGRASGILSYAALDLGDSDAAATHARAAWALAVAANDDGSRAWVRGTESLIARFQDRFASAAAHIDDGMRYAGHGTSTMRLLCGAAQCAANVGNARAAQELLDQAADAREHATEDAVKGLFGFSYAKQLYYAGSSLMWSDEPAALHRAERDGTAAIELWEHEDEQDRSLDDEALAHVYIATARIKLGEIDGAMAMVRPILALPRERQISWIRRRVGELADLLTPERFGRSRQAEAARKELRAS